MIKYETFTEINCWFIFSVVKVISDALAATPEVLTVVLFDCHVVDFAVSVLREAHLIRKSLSQYSLVRSGYSELQNWHF